MAAIETASAPVEDVKPKARRSRKAKVAASPVEPPVVDTPTPDTSVETVEIVEAQADLSDSEPVAETEAAPENADEAKPARANRASNVSSSAPVVTSTRATDGDDEPPKPRKAGWWQKRGFL